MNDIATQVGIGELFGEIVQTVIPDQFGRYVRRRRLNFGSHVVHGQCDFILHAGNTIQVMLILISPRHVNRYTADDSRLQAD
jgi:hypothetical protein